MRTRIAALVAGLLALTALGAHAAPTTTSAHWITATVSAKKGGPITLATAHTTFTVSSQPDTSSQMLDLLGTQDGERLHLRVEFEKGTTVKVTGVAGENPSAHALKVQPATDDYSAVTHIKKHAHFIITGQTTSEEEEGGLLYFDVAITGGGTGGDKNTGYVLAKDAIVVHF